MAVNNALWKTTFKDFPSWPCPACQNSVVVLKSDSLRRFETKDSISAYANHSNPTWVDERFSTLMQCQNESCGEVIAVGGNVICEEDQDDEEQQANFSVNFEPKFLHPAPKIFPVTVNCPYSVGKELDRAFALYWFDTGASANGLRKAIEALLGDQKTPLYFYNKKNRREQLNLHTKIQKFSTKQKDAAELLMAIKWLANAGSHLENGAISKDELLQGFDLFHGVIEIVYDKRAAHLQKIAKTITKRRGR